MAEFGIPDEPGFRGAPVLGPLAASVAGFTQGLERGLQSRESKKAALAKQQAQERVAKARASASASTKLFTDLRNLTKGDTDRVREISRQTAALKKQLGDVLSNLTDEQKAKIQFDINVLQDEDKFLRKSGTSFSRLEVGVRGLSTNQQRTFQQNFLRTTEKRNFVTFDEWAQFKKDFTAPFDPKVAAALGEALEAERERGTIKIDADILGPGEIVFDEEDKIDEFVEGLFSNG